MKTAHSESAPDGTVYRAVITSGDSRKPDTVTVEVLEDPGLPPWDLFTVQTQDWRAIANAVVHAQSTAQREVNKSAERRQSDAETG